MWPLTLPEAVDKLSLLVEPNLPVRCENCCDKGHVRAKEVKSSYTSVFRCNCDTGLGSKLNYPIWSRQLENQWIIDFDLNDLVGKEEYGVSKCDLIVGDSNEVETKSESVQVPT